MYFRGSANSSSVGRKVMASGIPCSEVVHCVSLTILVSHLFKLLDSAHSTRVKAVQFIIQ